MFECLLPGQNIKLNHELDFDPDEDDDEVQEDKDVLGGDNEENASKIHKKLSTLVFKASRTQRFDRYIHATFFIEALKQIQKDIYLQYKYK